MHITRGFKGKARHGLEIRDRVPPGQYVTSDFPVLTAGPTQHRALHDWTLSLQLGGNLLTRWDWKEFAALPETELKADIHCVTKWSKLDTRWRGVTVDDLLAAAGVRELPTRFLMAHCDGGYTTNYEIADLIDRRAMIATHY